jgi:hypothetical protein
VPLLGWLARSSAAAACEVVIAGSADEPRAPAPALRRVGARDAMEQGRWEEPKGKEEGERDGGESWEEG